MWWPSWGCRDLFGDVVAQLGLSCSVWNVVAQYKMWWLSWGCSGSVWGCGSSVYGDVVAQYGDVVA
jgi:hypothetical protein